MDSRLMNYIGIDQFNDYYNFKSYIPYKLEGVFKCDLPIDNLLSFGLSKECVDYKVLDIFEDTNYDGEEFHGNLVIINNKFDLDFEYNTDCELSMLSASNLQINKATYISLTDYDYYDLEITLLTRDLFCTLLNNNEIFYCANLIIGINEL